MRNTNQVLRMLGKHERSLAAPADDALRSGWRRVIDAETRRQEETRAPDYFGNLRPD